MIICGVCFLDSSLPFLNEIGVKDSKKLSPKKRDELSSLVRSHCHSFKIITVTPEEIDRRVNDKITMNRLEELKMAQIINELKPGKVYIDAADVNEDRFGVSILKLLNYAPEQIISKHRADDIFPVVSAASIIAKDKRDKDIEDLKKKFGDFGSGYPSDPKTVKFLKNWLYKYKKPPIFARKSWDTTKKLTAEITNKKITEFFV